VKRSVLTAGFALLALVLPAAASAAPFSPPSDLACRASALHVDLLNLDPIIANPQYNPCASDFKQLLSVPGLAGVLTASTALTPSANVGAAAHAQVANATVGLIPGLGLSADVITADAQTICVGGTTRDFTGSSSVANLVVNGTNYGLVTQPLDINVVGVAIVHVNYQSKTSAGVLQRGIWVQTLGAVHALAGDVIIAEAKSGRARFMNFC
jgi:hypothetical protein